MYRRGAEQVRAEYMRGGDGTLSKYGWYVLATHDVSPDWQVVGRYDVYDPDRAKADNRQTDVLLGCTRFLTKHNAKIQLNYVHNDRDSAAGESGDQLILNCQIAY